jgi:cytoskeletal protein CcmA (bactofilin family)
VNEQSSEAGCFTVGEGVSISGSFSVPSRAVINGQVDGEITAKDLLVGNSGKINGKVKAEVVDVHGEINDTLTASKALILRASGRAKGSIQYAELQIEKGAQLRGMVTMINDEPGDPAPKAATPAPKVAAVAAKA